MTNNSRVQGTSATKPATTGGTVARRSLLRAGLASAPVLAGLRSQSALATGTGNHMTCSVWASVKAAQGCRNSHTTMHVGNTCRSYLHWQNVDNTHCNKIFHQSTGYFDDICYKSSATMRDVCRGTFSNGSSIIRTGYTVTSKKSEFSKHCAAMYVNAMTDATCPIKATEIQSIWSKCRDGGYAPPPNIPGAGGWHRDEWCDYFNYICRGVQPSSWGSTCA